MRWLLGRAAFVLMTVVLASCRSKGSGPAAHPLARHLVVITIDTLRADHVGVYGYAQATTPHLDALARDGAMAEHASAHAPLTRPSHATLLTGRLPAHTGIRDNVSPAVIGSVPLLAEVLKKAGFSTGAFVSSVVLDSSSGLNRGFDVYSDRFEDGGSEGEARFLNTAQKTGDRTTAEAMAWLEKNGAAAGAAGRVFLWLHLYDPHDPYEPPEPHASRHRDRPYDGEVAFADDLVGRVDAALERLGLRKDTALIVASDHGEGLGEHGETLHGFFVYQSTLAVPFFVRGPGVVPGTRLRGTVRLVDAFPTALDLLGVAAPAEARPDGKSLAPQLRGQPSSEEPVVYAESLVPLLHFGWSDLRVIREGRWKYIQAPRPELYDLATDPGELTNLATAQASRAQALRGALARILESERASAARSEGAPAVPPELLEKLGALGYVGVGGAAETATPGADPKDRIEDFRVANELTREGLLRLHAGDYAQAAGRLRAVLARGIASFEVHFYLARALFGLKRFADAAQHFEEAARRAPAHAPAWAGVSESLVAAGDPVRALDALHRGEAGLPKNAGLRMAEARLLRDLGRKDEARRVYEATLPLAPANGRLRMQLGELLRDLGDVQGAIQRQREAVELEPNVGTFWNSLGMTLGGQGQLAEAEKAFREAWRLDDKNHRHAYNLALAILRQGRSDEARPFFQKALEVNPAFAPAREQLAAIARSRGK